MKFIRNRITHVLKICFLILVISIITFFVHVLSTYASTALDPTYGNSGKVITSFGNDSSALDVALQSDGKAVAVGLNSNGGKHNWVIARYNTDGSLDTSFGTNGIVTQDFGYNNEASKVRIQPDGKIVVSGSYAQGYAGPWLIGRYNSNGSLDTSFGTNGIAIPYSGNNNHIAGLFITSDNKIISAGYDGTNEVVVRQNADGSPDQTFGNGGAGTASPPGGIYSSALQSDGKIVLLGSNGSEIFVSRFNADGSIDTTFGNSGFTVDSAGNNAQALVLQTNGKIIVTGEYSSGTTNPLVIRYNQDGSHDTSFGSGGYVLDPYGTNITYPRSILILPDSRLILGGSDQNQANASLASLNVDGTTDTSFGTNGYILTPLEAAYSGFSALALQTDGKILATGFASPTSGRYADWALARYANIAASTTVTFDDISPVTPLNGTYAGINWGTSTWDVDGSIPTDTTNSISFHSATVTNGTFSFASPSVLLSTGIYSNSNQTALITLSCSGNNPVSMQVSPNAHVTLTTNWVTPCTTVTVTSSNGWNTNLDNLVYSSTQNPGVTPTPTPTPPPAPTGGNTTQGALLDTGDANNMNGIKFTTNGTGGAATSMSVFVGNVDTGTHNKFQMAIYKDNGGNPGTLVAKTATGTLTPLSWNSLSITANLSANTTYWLMYNTNATSSTNYLNNMYFDNGTSGIAAYAARTYGTWPTNFPTATLTNTNFSLYVSY